MRLPESKKQLVQRSINLAISSRGITALHAINPNIAKKFLASAIPMRGRMIHTLKGQAESQLYDLHGQVRSK
jgi:kynurenine 3-monooxygenase